MADLVSYSIPSLIQGVSQQPDAQRDPTQAEIQINAVSSIAEGLRKRDCSHTIAKVSDAPFEDVFIHSILRDEAEKYLAVIAKTGIKVFDLAGKEYAVNAPGGYGYLASVTDARQQIRAQSIADFTFILNTNTATAMNPALAPETPRPKAHEALVWVRAANYGQEYKVNVNGVEAKVTTAVAPVVSSGTSVTENRISSAKIAEQILALLLYGAATALTTTASTVTLKGPVWVVRGQGLVVSTDFTGVKRNVATTTDGSGSGLFIDIVGDGSYVTHVGISDGQHGSGYEEGAKVFVPRNILEGGTKTDLVYVVTVGLEPKRGLATTSDGGGHGLLVDVTGNSTTITSTTIGGSGGLGYKPGEKIFVARNLLDGGTDGTPVEVATVATSAPGPLTGVTITQSGSVLWLQSDNPITLAASDARANADITAILGQVQAFTELPTIAPKGYQVEITGDPSNNFDGYYVSFTPKSGDFGEGTWSETVSPGVEYKLDQDTMPHLLIRLPNGQFWFGPANGSTQGTVTIPAWGQRTTGDYHTAPDPSFIGHPINDVFIYKNRLGFLADENVILSRVREFFEFFPETVTAVLDTDPIDVIASNNRVSVLRYAVPNQDELFLFSAQYQFRFNASTTVLTPATAQVTVLTNYEMDPLLRPQAAGSGVIFCQTNGEWSQLREFSIRGAGTALVADSQDLTGYVSSYVPRGLYKATVNDTSNCAFFISEQLGFENRIYVYKYFFRNTGQGPERAQSSWSYWQFNGKVLQIVCIQETLYCLFQHGDQVFLEKISVQDRLSILSHPLLLDRQISTTTETPVAMRVPAGVYDPITRTTTWTLPYTITAKTEAWSGYGDRPVLDSLPVTKEISVTPGGVLLATAWWGNTLTARGDWSTAAVFFGEPYEFRYRFTRFKMMREIGGGKAAVNVMRTQVRSAKLRYHETGYFEVHVLPERRSEGVYRFDGTVSGVRDARIWLGFTPEYSEGVFNIPIMSRGEQCVVELRNSTPHPCKFSTCEWVALVTGRARSLQ